MVIQADHNKQNTPGVIYEHEPPAGVARGNGLVVAAGRACFRAYARTAHCGLARGPPELTAPLPALTVGRGGGLERADAGAGLEVPR